MISVVVGLGNPGERYADTPHNAGFAVVDALAGILKADFREYPKYLAARAGSAMLVKPLTFMNLSGEAVESALSRHRLNAGGLFVVCDDFALPSGKIRLRRGGSDGGHNGLKSVIGSVGPDFWRLRVGAGPLPDGADASEFVLRRLTAGEIAVRDAVARASAVLVLDFLNSPDVPPSGTWTLPSEGN